jgi:hypothetical protein
VCRHPAEANNRREVAVEAELSKRVLILNLLNQLTEEEAERIYKLQVMHVSEDRALEICAYAEKVYGVKCERKEYPRVEDTGDAPFVVYDIGPVSLFVT